MPKEGGGSLVFKKPEMPEFNQFLKIQLPCRKCMGCRISKSRDWALRICHESKMHDSNCVITITYDDDNLPLNCSLEPDHVRLFIKRLRKKFNPLLFRYFACAEYGTLTKRPHYHICLFGLDFNDKVLFIDNDSPDKKIYTSEILTKAWGLGHATVGILNFSSSSYCAKYVLKQHRTDIHDNKYHRINQQTGEILQVKKEFSRMSLKPGIGYTFYKKYTRDLYAYDHVIYDGHIFPVPDYYDKLHKDNNPNELKKLKKERLKLALSRRSLLHDNALPNREFIMLNAHSKKVTKI